MPTTDTKNDSLSRFLNGNIPQNSPERNGNGNNHSSFSDPAFFNNKKQPIHRWVPWIAGFSKEFVNDSIYRYIEENGTVLDPFAGVGTTLIESLLTGNDSVGFEINPYAFFACQTKIHSVRIDETELGKEIERFSLFYSQKVNSDYSVKSKPPEGFKSRVDFFSPKVLRKVLILQDFITQIESKEIADIFRLAFTSTMVKYSNYSYEPSLSTRKGAGKADIDDFDVQSAIVDKLHDFLKDIVWVRELFQNQRIPSSKVIFDSFFNYEKHLPSSSIDLIITSPPYLNNYHYNRNTRPQIYWLGFATCPNDFKPLENSNFGTYWQTARDKKDIDLVFELPKTDLIDKLDQIRKLNPDRGVYGGRGWANYAVSYFNDCYKFSQGIEYSLKSGATALVVIGNSILQGVTIPTDEYFAAIAESVGLEIVEIHIPRSKRIGNSIIQSDVRVSKATKGHKLYEAIVELKKS